MAMADAKVNHNFEESYVGVQQMLVTNTLGRILEHLEIVALGGYVGEVMEFDDIAISGTGMINIDPNRRVYTSQINITDTFTVGGVVHFLTGGSAAAGEIRSTPETDSVPLGICTDINAAVAIEFKPFQQLAGGVNDLKVSVYEVDADASTAIVVTGLVPIGARIIDVIVECTATVTSATLQLQSNNVSPVNITAALVCAVDNTIVRAAILTNNVVDADGL